MRISDWSSDVGSSDLSDSGLTASIIQDSGGARLVIKGETGAAQGFTIDIRQHAADRVAPRDGGGRNIARVEERRVGKVCVIKVRSRRLTYHKNKNTPNVNATIKRYVCREHTRK